MLSAKLLLVYVLANAHLFDVDTNATPVDTEQAFCLAKAVYYESGGEHLAGKYAVAWSTVNRVGKPGFPNTVCEVVEFKAASKLTNKITCAFSWMCQQKTKQYDFSFTGPGDQKKMEVFRVSSVVAISVLSGKTKDSTHGATHFHNPHTSSPSWAKVYTKTLSSGNHDFYRM